VCNIAGTIYPNNEERTSLELTFAGRDIYDDIGPGPDVDVRLTLVERDMLRHMGMTTDEQACRRMARLMCNMHDLAEDRDVKFAHFAVQLAARLAFDMIDKVGWYRRLLTFRSALDDPTGCIEGTLEAPLILEVTDRANRIRQ
jgi:hypothetical protein